jgi:Rrf2 family protein
MAKVIHFPKTVGIAIHALIFINMLKERMNVQRIAELTSGSKFHTAKILKELVKQGYLKSTRGPSGGFEIVKPADQIFLLDIWRAVEGEFVVKTCLSDQRGCVGVGCIFSDKIYRIQEKLYHYLKHTTIASLAERVDLNNSESS